MCSSITILILTNMEPNMENKTENVNNVKVLFVSSIHKPDLSGVHKFNATAPTNVLEPKVALPPVELNLEEDPLVTFLPRKNMIVVKFFLFLQ